MLKRDLAAEIPEVYWQMHFRGAVAMHFRDYFADCESNSPHETVVRARDKQSAIKRIKSVQKLIIRGVGFTDNEKNQQLIALLQALGDELSAGRGPSRTNRKSKKFPINRLVVALAGHFRTCFDEDCPKAVAELIAIIDPEALSDRQLQRVITSSHEPNPKTDKS
ncbi:hypothetical protein D2917_25405 [Cupriavidus oxalaticus]|uniref:Uncharacterized protein n=2 Tax=Cupriavidus oxalaticus TaxID=96344 RepID=A0A5P3VNB9_9BURK|nr:hypothetical protein D2917_25405 [Cupriavidus oxalaticus]